MASYVCRPFFQYFGGKWRSSAKHYPAPRYPTIVEPFAGSAGYSCRYADRDVILIEKGEQLARLWGWLIGAEAEDIMAVPLLEPGEETRLGDERTELFLSLSVHPGGGVRRCPPSATGQNGGSGWYERKRSRVASDVHKINHWAVLCGDYTLAPDIEATWFIDPPYQQIGTGKKYEHDRSGINYAELAEWCKSRRGQVIVCEQEGADWLPFRPLAEVATCASKTGKRSREVIWTNEDT